MTGIDDWLAVAIHESSHAAAYIYFGWRFDHVRLYEAGGEILGAVRSPAGRYNCTARAVVCLAGPLAEARHRGVAFNELARSGGRIDVAMAHDALSRRAGLPDLDQLLPFARALVAQEWPHILLIAAALLKYRRLNHAAVLRLLR